MMHACPLIFAILIYLKIKVNCLCWQVLLVICLTEPWAVQLFTILAEGILWHFHLPGNIHHYLILCYLLPRPNVLSLFVNMENLKFIRPFGL